MDRDVIDAMNRGDCEIIPANVPEQVVQEEMNHHSWKAGHTNRHGECMRATKIMSQGYGESKLNIWPRDERGELID